MPTGHTTYLKLLLLITIVQQSKKIPYNLNKISQIAGSSGLDGAVLILRNLSLSLFLFLPLPLPKFPKYQSAQYI